MFFWQILAVTFAKSWPQLLPNFWILIWQIIDHILGRLFESCTYLSWTDVIYSEVDEEVLEQEEFEWEERGKLKVYGNKHK